jgi:hypothetical protein
MRYLKRAIEVEAWQNSLNGDGIPDWVMDAIVICDDGTLTIRTLEGDMKASLNDWIIRGIKGEVYPCKPDIFNVTYEHLPDCKPPSDMSVFSNSNDEDEL